ncbi:MAG: prepilin-type N-terminal cleavage/methylation domain-containing protein [Nitrospirae bacterium]|nr:MAG: prepilin-type N-terminal cleavage/methylation domain-containing protein [Nitrospirota bacterium]
MKELPGGRADLTASREAGFTLLELMISFAIIALIVVAIAGSIRLAQHSMESGEKKADALERTRVSFTIINSQIQSQAPLTYVDDAKQKFYFEGDRETLQLSTNYSIWGREKGFVVVRYRVESDSRGKKTLLASEKTIGLDNSRETSLFTGFDTIFFEYFFKEPAAEQGTWIEKWTEETSVPEKIRLNLVMDRKDYSMIIPMRTAVVRGKQQSSAPGASTRPSRPGGRP